MDDLVQFLRARLDEDGQTARRAGDSFRQIGETGVIVATEDGRAEECATANWAGIAKHIIRHDPARVLAEVDAKRQAVDHYERVRQHTREDVEAYVLAEGAVLKQAQVMALPYADHPDYRPEWRPSIPAP